MIAPLISPLLLDFSVVCLGIFLLMLDAFGEGLNKRILGGICIAGLSVILVGTLFAQQAPQAMESLGFYVTDPTAMFFKQFLLLATILTVAMAMDYAPIFSRLVPAATPQAGLGEFFTLPVFACAGMMWMVSAKDFIMIFVSLELVTITFYVLVAMTRRSFGSLEAGVKYLILGALSTGFIVYGITWVFGITGQTNLEEIRKVIPSLNPGMMPSLMFGLALIFVSLGFKIAAFPFQFWVPDVYQGAPTPVTAFLSVASKAAGFVVLLRVLDAFLVVPVIREKVVLVFTIVAAATLLYGNLAAMPQTNFKRLMAYSSVAHAGYLLIAIASIKASFAAPAIIYYLAGYLLMTYMAFIVVVLVARAVGGDDIADFNGLARRSPGLALGMVIAMASLAGLPFTVGFLGKFFIFVAAFQDQQYLLIILGAITVACGFYYYLKVVRAMYWQPSPEGAVAAEVSPLSKVLLILLSIGIFALGLFPQLIFSLFQ